MAATTVPAQGADRRRSERQPYIIESWIASPTSARPEDRMEVTSLNLSRHGVCFHVTKPIPQGTFLTIEIGHGDQRLVSEIRTASCRRVDKGIFEIGAEFF